MTSLAVNGLTGSKTDALNIFGSASKVGYQYLEEVTDVLEIKALCLDIQSDQTQNCPDKD